MGSETPAQADLAPAHAVSEVEDEMHQSTSPSEIFEDSVLDDQGTESMSTQDERSKYTSPPPVARSSMTPPPSSQIPPRLQTPLDEVARTPTPTKSHLSSPPPTVKPVTLNGADRYAFSFPKEEEIASASLNELRTITSNLLSALREARASAAHYKLQHNLLSIETSEATQRMAVEHYMTRREIEVLQMAEQRRRSITSPLETRREISSGPNWQWMTHFTVYCEEVEAENVKLNKRLRSAKKMIMQKDGELGDLVEENTRLRRRIKENRDHINRMRTPGGIYGTDSPHAEPATPLRQKSRSSQDSTRPIPPNSTRNTRGEDAFATLLLADQVLSQESATAPSTPTRAKPSKAYLGHTRGAQSLSSMSSPERSRRTGGQPSLAPAPSFIAVNEDEQERLRREDRESTISASEMDDDYARHSDSELEESHASQMATHMLRRSPHPNIAVTPSRSDKNLVQSKLFGTARKAGIARDGDTLKRRYEDDGVPSRSKRARAAQPIGLGIGGWSSPR